MIDFDYIEGATPIDPDEALALLPSHIMTQSQLNSWEQANILEAEKWVFNRKHSEILSFKFCLKLHEKMFDKTWSWAGRLRKSNKNIGVFWEKITENLSILFDDVRFQIEHKSYSFDEIAARFHHRLVYIHPFRNGNGRHARLMTDVLLVANNLARFSWGSAELLSKSDTRKGYILSLKSADAGDYSGLLSFVRS